MPTNLAAEVHATGPFPSHLNSEGKGGWRAVADATARDAIPAYLREEGMTVRTIDDGKEWTLGADLSTWTLKPSGGVGADTLPVNVLDYGADPTGVASSQTAFENAIAAIKAASVQTGTIGGITWSRATITRALYVPRGVYKLTAQLLIDFQGFTIYGDGAANSVLAQSWTPTTYNDAILSFGVFDAGYTDPWVGVSQGYSAHDISFAQTSGGFAESADGTRKGCAILDAGSGSGRLVNLRFSGFGTGFLSYGADEMVCDQVIAEFCDYGFTITDAGEKWDFRNCVAYVCHTGLWMQAAHTMRIFSSAFLCCYEPIVMDEVTAVTYFGTTKVNGPCRNIVIQSCWFEQQVVSALPLRMWDQCVKIYGTTTGAQIVVNVQLFDNEVSAFWDSVATIPANSCFVSIEYGRNVVVRNLHIDRTGIRAYCHHVDGDDIVHLENLGPQQRWSPTTGSGWGHLPVWVSGDDPHYRFIDDEAHADEIKLSAATTFANPPTRTDLPAGSILDNLEFTVGSPMSWFWNGSAWLPQYESSVIAGPLGTARKLSFVDSVGAVTRLTIGLGTGNPNPQLEIEGFNAAGASLGTLIGADLDPDTGTLGFRHWYTSFGDSSRATPTIFGMDAKAGQNVVLDFMKDGFRTLRAYVAWNNDLWLDTYDAVTQAYMQSPLVIPHANDATILVARPLSVLNSTAAATPAANEVTFGAGTIKCARTTDATAREVVLGDDTHLPKSAMPANSDGVLTCTSGIYSWGAGATGAVAAYYAKIDSATDIAITSSTTATKDRHHTISGTSADYDIQMPTSPSAGDTAWFTVKDWAAANKQYRLDAGAGVLIAGRTRYLVLLHTNVAGFRYDGTDWQPLVMNLDTPWIAGGAITLTGSTTNPTKGTTTIDQIHFRRVAGSQEFLVQYVASDAGSGGSGDYYIGLPIAGSAETVFTGAVGFDSTGYTNGGTGWITNGTSMVPCQLIPYDTTKLRLRYDNWNVTTAYWGSGNLGTSPAARLSIRGSVRMTDW